MNSTPSTLKQILVGTCCALALRLAAVAADNLIERSYPLSSGAKGGFVDSHQVNGAGNLEVIYKYKGKNAIYEHYEFDRGLNLVKQWESETDPGQYEIKPDREFAYLYARTGGGNSFNIISTKLHLVKVTSNDTWIKERQRYRRKITRTDEFKARNEENRNYEGFDAFDNETTGGMMILAAADAKQAGTGRKMRQFEVLDARLDGTFQRFPIEFEHPHSLVYSALIRNQPAGPFHREENNDLENSDMGFIFAPDDGDKAPDPRQYTYVRMDKGGAIKERMILNPPPGSTIITSHHSDGGDTVYFCGVALKENKFYRQSFNEYAPLPNPSFGEAASGRMFEYEKRLRGLRAENFLLLKVKAGKVEWVKATPIKEFKAKLHTPPSQKGPPYQGRKLEVTGFSGLPDGGFFITGQLVEGSAKAFGNGHWWFTQKHREVIGLRFDSQGGLLAQFSMEPRTGMDGDSGLYPVVQRLVPGKDGGTVYWELWEPEAESGYATFLDALAREKTFWARFRPSVARIDLKSNSLSDFAMLCNGKIFLDEYHSTMHLPEENAVIYFGREKSGSTLWLAKYTYQ